MTKEAPMTNTEWRLREAEELLRECLGFRGIAQYGTRVGPRCECDGCKLKVRLEVFLGVGTEGENGREVLQKDTKDAKEEGKEDFEQEAAGGAEKKKKVTNEE
jgi:hypothetical protein